MDTIGKNANYEVANTLHRLLARLREVWITKGYIMISYLMKFLFLEIITI